MLIASTPVEHQFVKEIRPSHYIRNWRTTVFYTLRQCHSSYSAAQTSTEHNNAHQLLRCNEVSSGKPRSQWPNLTLAMPVLVAPWRMTVFYTLRQRHMSYSAATTSTEHSWSSSRIRRSCQPNLTVAMHISYSRATVITEHSWRKIVFYTLRQWHISYSAATTSTERSWSSSHIRRRYWPNLTVARHISYSGSTISTKRS